MKRAALMLAVGLMGTGCVIEPDPSVTLRWQFSRTVYDDRGIAAAVPYDCEQAGIDAIDVWVVEPDGRRFQAAGSPFSCRSFHDGLSMDSFARAHYEFDVFAYRGDALLYDVTATAELGSGNNTLVVDLVPYQSDVVIQANFPGSLASGSACPSGTATLGYTLVDGYNTVVESGLISCTDPYLVANDLPFLVDQHHGLDVDEYSIRIQGSSASGATTYDSCTFTFDNFATRTVVGVPLHSVSSPTSCPEDHLP